MKEDAEKIGVIDKLAVESDKMSRSMAELMSSKEVKKFDDNYSNFITHPNTVESKKFLNEFIGFLHEYCKKIKLSIDTVVLFEPKAFEFHLIMTLVPIPCFKYFSSRISASVKNSLLRAFNQLVGSKNPRPPQAKIHPLAFSTYVHNAHCF